jgi:hypothetical protein
MTATLSHVVSLPGSAKTPAEIRSTIWSASSRLIAASPPMIWRTSAYRKGRASDLIAFKSADFLSS